MFKKRINYKMEYFKTRNDLKNVESKNKRLQKLLDAQLEAKENGCYRGPYCSACKNGVLIGCTCYCTYGQCNHFEKETDCVVYENK